MVSPDLLADPGPANLFDQRVYQRGALTLHALRTRIGDQRFFQLLPNWTAQRRHSSVCSEEFVSLAGEHAGEDMSPFCTPWLYPAGAAPPAGRMIHGA